eukprot:3193009-Ditylum_brightwellii.AAC.1
MKSRLSVQLEFFDQMGWYDSKVTSIRQSTMTAATYKIEFTGGEIEESNQESFGRYKSETSISIGDVGYKFAEELPGADGDIYCIFVVANIFL